LRFYSQVVLFFNVGTFNMEAAAAAAWEENLAEEYSPLIFPKSKAPPPQLPDLSVTLSVTI
jgi:hypothetical protein